MDRQPAFQLEPDTGFLTDARAQSLCRLLEKAGKQAFFVGGCVRNAVMGVAASDIDIATDALPDDVMQITEEGGLRAVPTGIDHGTVTVIVGDAPFEITTFRRDVATDGRRAIVAFSASMDDDARRRDFTMNALYADRSGRVYDPVGGLQDAQAGRVRFIDDPALRLKEDHLRALRFFRFSAWYSDPELGWDAEALAAIADGVDGLKTLSAERVGAELLKLLAAPDPAPAVSVMARIGVLGALLPGADETFLGPVVHIGGDIRDPITRLAALGGEDVAARLRLSRKQHRQLDATRSLAATARGLRALGFVAGPAAAQGAAILRAAMMAQPLPKDWRAQIAAGADTAFPVQAADLPDLEGPALGRKLNALKQDWLASDLTLTKAQLLAS